jgi:RNA-directed DNA polymerase
MNCFDLWVNQWRKHSAYGDIIVVRYADDSVLGFQRKGEATKFLSELKVRLDRFGLSLNEDKTSLIRFGRFALSAYQNQGWGKPGTFDFLGFTHVCGQKRHTKEFSLVRQTSSKRLRNVFQKVKAWLMSNRHRPIPEQIKWLTLVMQGHMNYFAVPNNTKRLLCFRREIQKYWFKALKRRSQRFTLVWAKFGAIANKVLPKIKVLHPYPEQRFYAKYPK